MGKNNNGFYNAFPSFSFFTRLSLAFDNSVHGLTDFIQ